MEDKIRFFALGGLDEHGKNLYCIEINDNIFVLDCGFKLPPKTIPGVDVICANFDYLIENKKRVKAIIASHSHSEQAGGIPVLYSSIKAPIYCSSFTKDMIERYSIFFEIKNNFIFNVVDETHEAVIAGTKFTFSNLTHSVPGSLSVKIHTSQGIICYIAGFVFDPTATAPFTTGLGEIQFGTKDEYLALIISSENSTKPGYTIPKHHCQKLIQPYFENAEGKIMISNVDQNLFNLKEIFDLCEKYNKTVFLYLPKRDDKTALYWQNYFVKINVCSPRVKFGRLSDINRTREQDIVIIFIHSINCVFNMVSEFVENGGKELRFELTSKDTFINNVQSTPASEVIEVTMLDNLYKTDMRIVNITKKERNVIYCSEEDIKLFLTFISPKYFIPVDGYFFEMMNCAKLALGLSKKYTYNNIFVLEPGVPVIFENGKAKADYSNRIPTGDLYIDGIDIGNVGNNVVQERSQMSNDGIVIMGISISKSKKEIVGGPDVQMRGFVFLKDSENILREVTNIFVENVRIYLTGYYDKKEDILQKIVEQALRYVRRETGKSPVIIPSIVEID